MEGEEEVASLVGLGGTYLLQIAATRWVTLGLCWLHVRLGRREIVSGDTSTQMTQSPRRPPQAPAALFVYICTHDRAALISAHLTAYIPKSLVASLTVPFLWFLVSVESK